MRNYVGGAGVVATSSNYLTEFLLETKFKAVSPAHQFVTLADRIPLARLVGFSPASDFCCISPHPHLSVSLRNREVDSVDVESPATAG